MSQSPLFPLPEPQPPTPLEPTRPEHARVLRPDRQQIEWAPRDLDAILPQDHQARAIWDAVEMLDLSGFYRSIHVVVDGPGRPTTDPRVLLAVWALATVQGVGSARQLDRLCREHDAYRWLCGGVPINYHMLSDFRAGRGHDFDELLTQIVGRLTNTGAVTLERVAQDGMRVRASAGASSFSRKGNLEKCLREAKEQVELLAQQREHPDPGVSKREQSAKERAARERVRRVEEALSGFPEAEAAKGLQRQRFSKDKRTKVTEPRVSTTDPDARVMKMPNGGYNPAYNSQFATDCANGIIIGVAATNSGTDAHQAPSMVSQIEQRTGQKPRKYLMDGGFAVRDDITALERQGIDVYAPVRQPRNHSEEERFKPHGGDTPEVIAWRERMAREESQQIYRLRAATAEWANAQVQQHGVGRFNVRGLAKVTSTLLLAAIAHDLLRWISLDP